MAVNAMPVRSGDVLTAEGYNLTRPIFAWKTVNESVTNSIVDQLDDELFLPVEPFSVYVVLVCVSVVGSTSGDLRLGYSVPTGAQGRRHNMGLAGAATGTTGPMRISVHGWPTAVTYGVTPTSVAVIEEGVLYTESAGGVLHLQWAQNVVDATATVVEAGSFMKIQRVL